MMNLKVFYQKQIHILDLSEIDNLQQLTLLVQSQIHSPPLAFTLRANYLGGQVVDQLFFQQVKNQSIKIEAVYVNSQDQINYKILQANNSSQVIRLQFNQNVQYHQTQINFDKFLSIDTFQVKDNQTNSCVIFPSLQVQAYQNCQNNNIDSYQSGKNIVQDSPSLHQKRLIEQIVVQNIQCDICFAFPITGPIYKCLVCKQFDICSICEQKYHHFHPTLKITAKAHYPSEIVIFYSQQSKKFMQVQFEAESQQIAKQKRSLLQKNQQKKQVFVDPKSLQSQTHRSKCFLSCISNSQFI